MSVPRKNLIRYMPALIGVGVVLIIATGVIFFVKNMLDEPVNTKKMVQQISLIQPPPPPPPEKIEKPPEPEIEDKVEVDEPEDVPDNMPDAMDDMPSGDDLGLDADGMAGSDAFGLIGRKGGRDLLASGYGWYSNILQQDIVDFLSTHDMVRSSQYSIALKLWIAKNGKVKKIELIESTGDAAIDRMIRVALGEMGQFSEKPPADMPQPVRLKITSKL